MKRIAFVLTLTLSGTLLFAQPGKTKPVVPAKTTPAKTGVKTPGVVAPVLKTMLDSASYAIGVSVANFYKQQGVKQLSTTMCAKAINDVMGNKPALLNEAVSNDMMNRFMNSLHAATPKPAVPAKTPVKKPGTPASPFKSLQDSASYAIGMSVADFYKQQGITNLNTNLVSRAITDIMGGKPALINDMAANELMNRFMTGLQEEKAKPNIEEGNAFLEANKKRPGVQVTASGLQYEVVKEGTGIKPLLTDSVTVNYMGTLVNGTEFDNSYKRGQPITFFIRGVIPGWTEGLQLMSVGSKYKFYIPYTLAYGAFDYGPIPGGSALIFEVDLLEVRKGPGSH